VREHRSGGGGRHAENECRRQNEERKAANRRRWRDPHKGAAQKRTTTQRAPQSGQQEAAEGPKQETHRHKGQDRTPPPASDTRPVSNAISPFSYANSSSFASRDRVPSGLDHHPLPPLSGLSFTRYCHCQYCIVFGIQTVGRGRGRILRNSPAIALHSCRLCMWGGNKRMMDSHKKSLKRNHIL